MAPLGLPELVWPQDYLPSCHRAKPSGGRKQGRSGRAREPGAGRWPLPTGRRKVRLQAEGTAWEIQMGEASVPAS